MRMRENYQWRRSVAVDWLRMCTLKEVCVLHFNIVGQYWI